MNKSLIWSSAVIVLVIGLCMPGLSHAYFTTDQSATVLDGGAAYTVTYSFGSPHYDLYLPIMTTRVETGSSTVPGVLAYSTVNKDGVVSESGQTKGIVLSNAEIRDGQYFIPKGQARQMTLLVALATSSSQEVADTTSRQLAIQVTGLPFTMIDDGRQVSGKLNQSELQYYITPYAKVLPKR